ncbi:trace amine-associated receptor 13c-like [Lethenteron reissneri]|uniref:trace amine-associated receptor 13c-like n=1 Tax=Lethenteron reissneri TaxID=7753 RepID=UPI002AB67367|nr:trace amine-associated receptor 13c-like [Lethenteron reissneri]
MAQSVLKLNSTNLTNVSSNRCVLNAFQLLCPPLNLSYASSVLVQTALVICIVAIAVGNTLVIVSIAYFRKLQSRMNVFTLSLALTDFLVGVLIMPFSMLKTVHNNCWFFGRWFCKIHTSLDYVICTVSILHLSCIAYDRYNAICHPLCYTQRVNRAKVVVMLGVCWVAPVIYVAPIMLGWNIIGIEEIVASMTCPDSCVMFKNITFMVMDTVCAVILPMILMGVAYAKIYRVVRDHSRRIHSQHQQQVDGNALKREHNATKTLGLIMGAYCVCWLPYCVVNVVDVFNNYQTSSWVWSVVTWLGYINSGFNPVLYALFSRPFRRAFAIVLSKRIFTSDTRNMDLFRED